MLPHDELYHYGVKGMKWGIRKIDDPAKLESRAAKQDRKAKKDQARYDKYRKNPYSKEDYARHLEFRAEEHRRKAGRIRAKKLSPEEREKALKTFNKFDKHNQYKRAQQIQYAALTVVGAVLLYPYLKFGLKLMNAVGGAAAIKTMNRKYAREQAWQTARKAGKVLPAKLQSDILKKRIKTGASYVINDNGTLSKVARFKL